MGGVRGKGIGVRDGTGAVKGIKDGRGRYCELGNWKKWDVEEEEHSSGEDTLSEVEEILQWTEVLCEFEWGECAVEGEGIYTPRGFEKWARGIKDRIDAPLREKKEVFGIVGREPDSLGKRADIMREERGTMGGEDDIEIESAANNVGEGYETVESVGEKEKCYNVRQKRPAEIWHGKNKRQRIGTLRESEAEDPGYDGESEEWVTQRRGTAGSSQVEEVSESNFSFGATNFPARVPAEATISYMGEKGKTRLDTVMERRGNQMKVCPKILSV